MIFLDGEEGDLGRRGPSRGDWREEVACEVEWLFGRVGRCCRSFAFFFGKETCFPEVLLSVETSVHPESIALGLEEERISNISSKPPTSMDGGSRTTEDMIF